MILASAKTYGGEKQKTQFSFGRGFEIFENDVGEKSALKSNFATPFRPCVHACETNLCLRSITPPKERAQQSCKGRL